MYSNPFKSHEREHELRLSGDYVTVRLDMENGKHVCKQHVQPYDSVFLDSVIDTFRALIKFVPGVIVGYVNSDEISLVWPTSRNWQENRILKICSILASYAGKELNNHYRSRITPGSVYTSTMDHLYFDCRAFSLSFHEVLPYIKSRQNCIIYGNLHWKAKQFLPDQVVQRHKTEKDKILLLKSINQDFENDPKRFSYGVIYTLAHGFDPEIGDFRQKEIMFN